MIVCVQCAMRAVLEGKEVPHYEGSIEAHMKQFHPDPIATGVEREQMERQLRALKKESKNG